MAESSIWLCFIYLKKIGKDDAGHFSIMAFIKNCKNFEYNFRIKQLNLTENNEIFRVVKTCKCLLMKVIMLLH